MLVRDGEDGAGAGSSESERAKVGLGKGGGSSVFGYGTGTRRRGMLVGDATAKGGQAKLAHSGDEQVPSRGRRRSRRGRRRGGSGEWVQASASVCSCLYPRHSFYRNNTTRTSTSPSTLTIRIFTSVSPASSACGPFSPTNRIDDPTTSRTISPISSDLPSRFFHAIFTSHMSSASSIVPAELGHDIAELPVNVDDVLAADDFLDREDPGTAMLRQGGVSTHRASHDGHVFPDSFDRSHCMIGLINNLITLIIIIAYLGNMFPTKHRIAAPCPKRLNSLA